MFKITDNNSSLFTYRNHLYSVYKPKKGTQNAVALKRVFRLFEIMLSYYSRVFLVRVDLHPHTFSVDNKVMSLFLKMFIAKLEVQYQCKVGYFCAREQNKSEKQHYHLVLLLSGHKAMLPHNILIQLQADWAQHCQGSVYFVDKPYYMIHRGDKASIDPAAYRISYLTKNHTKEHNKPANSYLCNEGKLRAKYKGDSNNEHLLVDPMITHRAKQKELKSESNIAAYQKPKYFQASNIKTQLQSCRLPASIHLKINHVTGHD
ncbi:YagK/YfjJ domain-containing protein [Colwellia piezophila]|uniref:YagK/YfjJ domain-containing protein n=1 Tax=Colwellia piezophila TaxID=211668 RepID=UPI00035C288B|nr:inovirus-type Gp2 protein [Colwellia piezophila]